MEFLVFAALLGLIPGLIAHLKGRSFLGWWIYGALVFIVALPHPILLKRNEEEIEEKQLQSGSVQKCPFCAELIKREAVVCRYCGRNLANSTKKDDNAVTQRFGESLEKRRQP